MASRSDPAAEVPRQQPDSGSPRNMLSMLASVMFFGGFILVCGLCAGGVYFFQPHVRDDPAAVHPLMADLLEISVPAQFEPRAVIEWNWAFTMSLRGAYYEMPDAESEGLLAFLEVQSRWSDDPDVAAHIRQALYEKGGGVRELELIGETETRTFDIRGQSVDFAFETRSDPATEQTYRIIEGVVDGTSGQVWIGIRVRTEWSSGGADYTWDDATAIAMIESIQ